jgi:predicted NAD/FAD-binding protein
MLQRGGGPTEEEREILGAFEWSKNEAVLHWDERVRMTSPPKNVQVWS